MGFKAIADRKSSASHTLAHVVLVSASSESCDEHLRNLFRHLRLLEAQPCLSNLCDHLGSKLLCFFLPVELLDNLQGKLQRGSRALAGDDIPVHHGLGICPDIPDKLFERRSRVASGRSSDEAVLCEDDCRACANGSRDPPAGMLLFEKRGELSAVTEALCPRHPPWACNRIPLLVHTVTDQHVRNHLQPPRHPHLQLWLYTGNRHFRARSREHVRDAGRLDFLGVICNGDEHAKRRPFHGRRSDLHVPTGPSAPSAPTPQASAKSGLSADGRECKACNHH
mmetsp:Transcript_20725/g.57361  ORF Transcript_20725/g.57361 Transcript_20725/m.57361 type:complete len:281 (-) Transcript_20725:297-1139(-)